jgi:2-polyprenyl-3-methyl-5-hydroxy-6-metoxy-1,4-benzoquinol methylase
MPSTPYNVVLLQEPGYVHALGLSEIGQLLHQSFRSLGVPSRFQINHLEPEAINVLLGYHRIADAASIPSEPFIVLQLEQLSDREGSFRPVHLEIFRRAIAVWDYSIENVEFLRSKGLTNVRHLPIGYHEALETIEHTDPEIDVLFYGSINERRRRVLRELSDHCTVKPLFGVYGPQRDHYIARSRIILNVHFYESQVMEQVRLSYLLNNRCFVLSESSAVNPFGDSIVTAPYEQLADCVHHWLARPEERSRKADAAYRAFRARPMTEYLARVLSDDESAPDPGSGPGAASSSGDSSSPGASPMPDGPGVRPVRLDQPSTQGHGAASPMPRRPSHRPMPAVPRPDAGSDSPMAASGAAASARPSRSARRRTEPDQPERNQTEPKSTGGPPAMHQSSFHRMAEFAALVGQRFAQRPIRVLDIGSKGVNGTYRELFSGAAFEYVGLDIDPGPNVDVVPEDPYDWQELDEERFDVIVSGQVLEHLEFPWLTMEQIAKKLKPNGLVCLIAPSRGPEHRFPVDCFRFYPDGMQALAKWAGLDVLEADCVRGRSGFQDGSDQWGDCYCVLKKNAAAVGEVEKCGSSKPQAATPTAGHAATAGPAPADSASADVSPPEAAPACPSAATGTASSGSRARHTKNPLDHPKIQNYYNLERTNVITAIQRHGLQAKRILELGCSAGATGQKLKQLLGADHYVGIEICEEAAQLARTRLDEVHVANIEQTPLESLGLKRSDFDLVLALDVLEHLYNPWEALAQLSALLRPNGHAVLSIPNVQNITLLNDLINGRWTYESAGLLDATHLRFFTFHEIGELVTGAGLSLVDMTAVLNPQIDLQQLKDNGNAFEVGRMRLSNFSRREIGHLFTYQYLVTSRKAA